MFLEMMKFKKRNLTGVKKQVGMELVAIELYQI
jgi:hypothetical protein